MRDFVLLQDDERASKHCFRPYSSIVDVGVGTSDKGMDMCERGETTDGMKIIRPFGCPRLRHQDISSQHVLLLRAPFSARMSIGNCPQRLARVLAHTLAIVH